MKLVDHFAVLLSDTINLSKFNLDLLDDRVSAIYRALASDAVLGPFVKGKIPQGSWAHRTIIKPVGNKEFDADFLLLLDEKAEWSASPSSYVNEVYSALGRSSIYKDMPRSRKCRCTRVVYANSCHVDVVPFLKLADGREVIVNRDEDDWEDADPHGFTRWMKTQDDITGGNLRRVIRLLKFLRDHKGTFLGTRSVILTTLIGQQVDASKKVADAGYYASVPAALRHIVDDLDSWLQARPARPSVADPSGSGATFDHRWDDATYATFRERVHLYSANIAAAYDEPDKDTSVKLWQDIFGTGFHAPPPKESSGRFAPVAPVAPRSGRAG